MKKLIIALTLSLIAVTASAQFSDQPVQSYVNNVTENVQGVILEYGERDGLPFVRIEPNEHLGFSMMRTMIGLITSTDRNVEVISAWEKSGDMYQYAVSINMKYAVVLFYNESQNLLAIAYSQVD